MISRFPLKENLDESSKTSSDYFSFAEYDLSSLIAIARLTDVLKEAIPEDCCLTVGVISSALEIPGQVVSVVDGIKTTCEVVGEVVDITSPMLF